MFPLNEFYQKILDSNYDTEAYSDEEKILLKTAASLTKKILNDYNEKLSQECITVKSLFWRTKFDDVFQTLVDDFHVVPLDSEYYFYQGIYNTVLKQNNQKTKYFLKQETNAQQETNVSLNHFDSANSFAIDFMSYEEIANSFVHPSSFYNASNSFVVAAFLDEFSWNPDDESKDQWFQKITDTKKDITDMLYDVDDSNTDATTFSVISTSGDDKSDSTDKTFVFLDDEPMDFESDKEDVEPVFTIREALNKCNYLIVKENYLAIFEDSYTFPIKIKHEELSKLFDQNFFILKNFINSIPKNNATDVVYFESFSDYFYTSKDFINDEGEEEKITCIYNGEAIKYIADFTFKPEYTFLSHDENNIVAFLMFSFLCDKTNYIHFRDYSERYLFEEAVSNQKLKSLLEEISVKGLNTLNDMSIEKIELLSLRFEKMDEFLFPNYTI